MPTTAGAAFKGTAKWLGATTGIIIMVVIVVCVAAAALYVGKAMLDRLVPWWAIFIDDAQDESTSGRIFVDSPEVYTRERLVNDRLQHATWLERQLRATDHILEEEGSFQSIEGQILSSQRTLTALEMGVRSSSPNEGSSEKNTKKNIGDEVQNDKGPKRNNDGLQKNHDGSNGRSEVKPTSTDLFRAMADYRELVRAELMQTQLDDRHDIEGNTLYHLVFDTSVLHGNKTSNVALIKVRIRHDAAEPGYYKKLCFESDKHRDKVNCRSYRRVYEDWIGYLEKTVNEWSDHRARGMLEVGFPPEERVEIFEYLRRCIERRLLIINSLHSNPYAASLDCAAPKSLPTSNVINAAKLRKTQKRLPWIDQLIQRHIERYRSTYLLTQRIQYGLRLIGLGANFKEGENFKENEIQSKSMFGFSINKLKKNENYEEIDYYSAKSYCQKKAPNVPSAQLGISEPTFKVPLIKRNAKLSGRAHKELELPCPETLPQVDALKFYAVVDLYNRTGLLMRRLISGNANRDNFNVVGKTVFEPGALSDFETAILGECPEKIVMSQQTNIQDNSNEWACPIRRPEIETTREIATGFQREKLLTQFPKIDGLIKVGLDGCGIGSCRLRIASSGRWVQDPSHRDPNDSMHRKEYVWSLRQFAERLNDDVEVYSYGVTPKNLRQRFMTSVGSSDLLSLMMIAGASAGNTSVESRMKMMEKHLDEVESIQGFPVVVGFGSVDAAASVSMKKQTEFGWIIAAQPRGRKRGTNEFWQPHQQYSLSSVLSVPSWWKNIDVKVDTCWRDFGKVKIQGEGVFKNCGAAESDQDTSNSGPDTSSPRHEYVIKLPGDHREITRKLRVDVFEEPRLFSLSLTETAGKRLRIGHSGKLLIRGSRLWRSTKVTLGSQIAEKVMVLPNMEGVIAEFDCVGRPAKRPTRLPPTNWRPEPSSEGKSLPLSPLGPNILVYNADLRVWTSEGVTKPPLSVELVEPENLDDQSPCGENGKDYQKFSEMITEVRMAERRIIRPSHVPASTNSRAQTHGDKPAEVPSANMSQLNKKAPQTANPPRPVK